MSSLGAGSWLDVACLPSSCSVVFSFCFFHSFPYCWEIPIFSLRWMAVSETRFLKEKWRFIEGWAFSCPPLLSWNSCLDPARILLKGRGWLRLSQMRLYAQADCPEETSKRDWDFQGPLQWLFPAWQEKRFRWSFCAAFSEKKKTNKPTNQNMCFLERLQGRVVTVNPEHGEGMMPISA